MKVKRESEVTQLCLTLSDPMDCSLPGSSVHGIFQAKVLEWGAIAFSKGSPAAAVAAKSLQSCPTLCDPIDGSPPGPSVPGILQARTLEWVGRVKYGNMESGQPPQITTRESHFSRASLALGACAPLLHRGETPKAAG